MMISGVVAKIFLLFPVSSFTHGCANTSDSESQDNSLLRGNWTYDGVNPRHR